ncbi:hypothetical protein [Mycobacterium conspicuum]|uniref:Uncharacterized protein n=1 Tax=Mycobacterium conspicuum TaxID=44010 RepID=A0A1X1TPX3_9MYCO|nr:hypothetical protein [Mycobacterium conspicuum]ORV46622.1 hypothetical protein AWC00_02425 [Mycobacterium conspicuum]BBZ40155.1 hypothetical protein MCNS_32180 [Mycobacterium conspicuum]
MKLIVIGAAVATSVVALAPQANATTFYPSGAKGDHSVAEVRYDLAQVDAAWEQAMPDEIPAEICRWLHQGKGETAVIADAEEVGLPPAVAHIAVYSSEWHFCPEYY